MNQRLLQQPSYSTCPKCSGRMWLDPDEQAWVCLQCGKRIYLSPGKKLPDDSPKTNGRTPTAQEVTGGKTETLTSSVRRRGPKLVARVTVGCAISGCAKTRIIRQRAFDHRPNGPWYCSKEHRSKGYGDWVKTKKKAQNEAVGAPTSSNTGNPAREESSRTRWKKAGTVTQVQFDNHDKAALEDLLRFCEEMLNEAYTFNTEEGFLSVITEANQTLVDLKNELEDWRLKRHEVIALKKVLELISVKGG